jgi:flagellin-specific chaperone FliS
MKSSFVVGAVYLACQMALTPSMLSAAAQNTTTKNSTSSKTSQANDHSSEQLSRLATRMLQQVDEARQALATKQNQTAVNHINRALGDRQQLASDAKAKGRSMIVPLYSEFDDTSVLGPMLAGRKGGKQQPSTSAPITVDEASAQYTFVGLDLDKAKSRLEAAKTALRNNNSQAATDSLTAVGDDLVVETEQADFPLLAARENLGIAEGAVKNGKYQEATAALKEASTDLHKYANGNSAHQAEEARELGKKMDSFSQTITQNHAENHGAAVSKIDGWWHEVDGWFLRPNQP